jgi:hypothetical protein
MAAEIYILIAANAIITIPILFGKSLGRHKEKPAHIPNMPNMPPETPA